MISVIIPVYNEEELLKQNEYFFKRMSEEFEVIFVDGASSDSSLRIASGIAKVVTSEKGRAFQMNKGAKEAKGDTLFFLHADNIIETEALKEAERKISRGFIGGCFTQRIMKQGFIYRIIEGVGNTRARAGRVFYGDQGIFVKKDVFNKMGGFPAVPLAEDVIFTRKLRKMGETAVLPEEIKVSARRWEEKGITRTVLLYSLINILFWLGVPLHIIKPLYGDLR